MFQTEPIIYLQSLGTQWFTFLMIIITTMGKIAFIIPILLIIIFYIDFKKGVLLFQLIIWTLLIFEIIKILVAFPRPDFVDIRVHNLEFGIANASPFSGNINKDIFALPDKEILKAFMLQKASIHDSYGFPSGHVALTTALWGGAAIVFKNKILKLLTPFAIIIMAFSRVYLGRHFIGDVIGGAILGFIILVIFSHFLKSSLKDDFFKKESYELAFRRSNTLFYFFMFLIPVICYAFSIVDANVVALFLGTNFSYIQIIRKGIPIASRFRNSK